MMPFELRGRRQRSKPSSIRSRTRRTKRYRETALAFIPPSPALEWGGLVRQYDERWRRARR